MSTADLDDLMVQMKRLQWQADILRAAAEADLRRAKFRFVHIMRKARAEHPFVARAAWWYWRHWLKRGWDGRKVQQ